MNQIQVIVVLMAVVGGSLLVSSQCTGPPPVFKRPEECCSYGKLLSESVMDGCRGQGGPKGPPPGGPRQPGDPIKGCCKTECAFNQTGLYANGALNEPEIRTTFAANVGAAFVATVNSALDACLPLARSRTAEFTASVTSGANQCSPITIFLFLCVNSNMVANCPTASFSASDADCVSLQTYFKQCANGPQ